MTVKEERFRKMDREKQERFKEPIAGGYWIGQHVMVSWGNWSDPMDATIYDYNTNTKKVLVHDPNQDPFNLKWIPLNWIKTPGVF